MNITPTRREMLQLGAAGVFGFSFSNWLPLLAARAAETQQRTKSCILLWMDGGPSHKDTFDLRPGTEQGGPFREIETAKPQAGSHRAGRVMGKFQPRHVRCLVCGGLLMLLVAGCTSSTS